MFFSSKNPDPPIEESKQQPNVLLSSAEFKMAMLRLISPDPKLREGVLIPRTYGPVMIKTNEEKMIESIFESCIFKCIMSCVLGKKNLKKNKG